MRPDVAGPKHRNVSRRFHIDGTPLTAGDRTRGTYAECLADVLTGRTQKVLLMSSTVDLTIVPEFPDGRRLPRGRRFRPRQGSPPWPAAHCPHATRTAAVVGVEGPVNALIGSSRTDHEDALVAEYHGSAGTIRAQDLSTRPGWVPRPQYPPRSAKRSARAR
jgi:hypothetical protein